MIRPPLFGKDSSPQYTAPRLAAMGTGFFTLVFLILVLFVPAPKPKEKFETVRILLDTTPIQDIFENAGESSGEIIEPAVQNKIENSFEEIHEEVIETPTTNPVLENIIPEVIETPNQIENIEPVIQKPQIENKNEIIKEEPQWTKRTDNDWASRKSIEDLIAEQVENRSTSDAKNFDWDSFSEDSGVTSSTQKSVQKKMESSESLSGSSATGATKTTERQSTVEKTKTEIQKDPDQSTSSALKEIANTEYTKKNYLNSNSSLNMKTAETSGGTSVSMDDGTSRTLEKPREPKINISSDMAKEISQSVTVKIVFTVMPDGSIPESSVQFIPAGLLTEDLKDDIRFQLSTWKFQKGSNKANASFDFTIQKK